MDNNLNQTIDAVFSLQKEANKNLRPIPYRKAQIKKREETQQQ